MSKIKRVIYPIMFLALIIFAHATIDKEWSTLFAGKQVLLTSDDEMALYQIILFSAEERENVTISINFEEGAGAIYQTINIDKQNLDDTSLSPGSIRLKVKNSWFEKNNITTSDMVLRPSTSGLFGSQTIFTRKDENYSYFQGSITPIRSFVITTSEKATPAQAQPEIIEATKTGNESKNEAVKATSNAEPSCIDGIKNQNEIDVDCGGPCKKCGEGNACRFNNDCATGYCLQSICKKASCSDNLLNQKESDVDCGGSCSNCNIGKKCNSNDDCISSYCTADACENLIIQKEKKPAFEFKMPEIKINEQTKKRIFTGISIGVVLFLILLLIFFIAKKSSGRKGKEPSVNDLIRLYDQIKRI